MQEIDKKKSVFCGVGIKFLNVISMHFRLQSVNTAHLRLRSSLGL